jgi:hypothetical protein
MNVRSIIPEESSSIFAYTVYDRSRIEVSMKMHSSCMNDQDDSLGSSSTCLMAASSPSIIFSSVFSSVKFSSTVRFARRARAIRSVNVSQPASFIASHQGELRGARSQPVRRFAGCSITAYTRSGAIRTSTGPLVVGRIEESNDWRRAVR